MVRCAASKFALCQLAQPKLAPRALLACFRPSPLPAGVESQAMDILMAMVRPHLTGKAA